MLINDLGVCPLWWLLQSPGSEQLFHSQTLALKLAKVAGLFSIAGIPTSALALFTSSNESFPLKHLLVSFLVHEACLHRAFA